MISFGPCSAVEFLLTLYHPLEGFCQDIEFQQKNTSDTSFASGLSIFLIGTQECSSMWSKFRNIHYRLLWYIFREKGSKLKESQNSQGSIIVMYDVSLLNSTSKDGLWEILGKMGKEWRVSL